MGNGSDSKKLKISTIKLGGARVGLIGIEQAFEDVKGLDLPDEEAAGKLLEIVARKYYIVEGAKREYKMALLEAYKNYLDFNQDNNEEKMERVFRGEV